MRPASRFALVWGICLFLVPNDQAGGQTPPLILTGSPGDRLGLAVANAGDVNGDGSDDLIIGADHYFGNKIGEAKIYFGGAPHDFTADVVLSRGAGFGWAVAGAGDVNGDGYDDVLVSENSVVYLYFGGAPMDTTPDAVIPPVPSTTFFGLEVAGAGDVNNDGYDDYIITSVAEEGIFVYFGSPVPGTTPDLALRGASRASSAGDINKDGYDDIITGFPIPPPDQSYAYLYFGGAPMDTIPDLILGTGLGDLFGSSVAGGGDLNGDGWPDLIICAAGDATGGANAGRAYVYFGGATLDTIPDFTYAGSGTNNLLGYKEAGFLGDINSDGYDDFFVSSDVETNPFYGKMGKVHIFRGGPDIANDTTLVGEDNRGNFGWSVASMDFDGNDDLEVFIGASYAPYAQKSGKVYLYTPPSDWLILTGSPGDRFGLSVAGAGDVNNDGYPDMIIGADHFYGDNVGRAYIYFGGASADFVADVVLVAETGGDLFGWSVAGAGDVNKDGFDDVLVGEVGATGNGRASLYFGGTSMDSIADAVMLGPPNSFRFGHRVAGAGDVNNDGYADMLISAGQLTGAFLYFGGATPSIVPDRTLVGYNATSAGDLNKDGYDDIICGFPSLSGPSWAYVYFGGAPMDTIADLTLGPGNADGFGVSVDGGSDINGDGDPDFLVGALGDDAGGLDAGKVYVYFGGSVLDTIPDYIITGSPQERYLGNRVVCLGDLDRDGYGDFAVSSDIETFPLSNVTGRVHFFRGGPTIRPDTILHGEQERDNFGWSLAPVGDFTDDGIPDVIIGAPYAPFAYRNGRAYLSWLVSPLVPVVEEFHPVPQWSTLMQNYPNPFNPVTKIQFTIVNRQSTIVKVFDLLGREVATLVNEVKEPGRYEVEFDAAGLSSGIYFYRLEAGAFMETRKLVLLR